MKGIHPGYDAAHKLIRIEKGKASIYPCIECNRQAECWALMKNASETYTENRRGISLEYSLNPYDYQPMCVKCHRQYDRKEYSNCKNDHDYDIYGFYIDSKGTKVCKKCVRDIQQRYKERKVQA